MVQEIKTEDVNFPYDDFASMDYESHVFGQKSYNGVAIISKNKLNNVRHPITKQQASIHPNEQYSPRLSSAQAKELAQQLGLTQQQ